MSIATTNSQCLLRFIHKSSATVVVSIVPTLSIHEVQRRRWNSKIEKTKSLKFFELLSTLKKQRNAMLKRTIQKSQHSISSRNVVLLYNRPAVGTMKLNRHTKRLLPWKRIQITTPNCTLSQNQIYYPVQLPRSKYLKIQQVHALPYTRFLSHCWNLTAEYSNLTKKWMRMQRSSTSFAQAPPICTLRSERFHTLLRGYKTTQRCTTLPISFSIDREKYK